MNRFLGIGLAVIAVVLAAVIGLLLIRPSEVGGPGPSATRTPEPSATAPPSEAATGTPTRAAGRLRDPVRGVRNVRTRGPAGGRREV